MSQQINLFNPIFLRKKKYFSAANMAVALGVLVAGMLAIVAYATTQVANLTREAQAVSSQLTVMQSELVKTSTQFAARKKDASLQEELQQATADMQNLQKVFGVLKQGDLGNTEGYADYLRAFARQSIDGLWLTGLSIQGAGNDIGISGRALQPELVPVYIGRLKSEPVMQGKSFATLEMTVPQVDNPDAKATPEKPGKIAANYIEFSLQSAANAAQAVSSQGGRK